MYFANKLNKADIEKAIVHALSSLIIRSAKYL